MLMNHRHRSLSGREAESSGNRRADEGSGGNRANGGSGTNRATIEVSDEESEEREPATSGQPGPAVSGWARLVRHLRRVRSRQRLFGYLGQVLQWYPPTLRDRLRRVDPTASQSRR